MILGTAGYMSPEQAAGKAVDRRTDIWAFGVVLWELLCGSALFSGETVTHTIADVMRAEIDVNKLPAGTPSALKGGVLES
jgi:serine/threonine protein kinase